MTATPSQTETITPAAVLRVALLGNPNTGKTTLFNRLCGMRHKTSNFPGTTQEARIGVFREIRSDIPNLGTPLQGLASNANSAIEVVDLPGIYSLELEQHEADICRRILAGTLSPRHEPTIPPDVVMVVLDATNLARNLVLAGEVLRRRLPTVVVINMIDLAQRRGLHVDDWQLAEDLGCEVVSISARSGQGCDRLRDAILKARIPNHTPPGTQSGLEAWAEELHLKASSTRSAGRLAATLLPGQEGEARARETGPSTTDRLDHIFTHPVLGMLCFAIVMAGLFWAIFSLATYPMDILDAVFQHVGGRVKSMMSPGILRDFLSQGVVTGVGAVVIFLPQICLLFFLISLLEDTGYLARASFVMDRVLRPFGLPGHSFVPLLSSHACALPGIMACRSIPDRRQRLATILVAPFMTCSARIPVYALVTGVLFPGRPLMASLAFVGCYALGMCAGVLSALVARRTILRGASPPMMLELPTYKLPSLRTAMITTWDRAVTFVKNAGTNILAICILLWWLGAYPKVDPPARATELRQIASTMKDRSSVEVEGARWSRVRVEDEARRLEIRHAKAHSFIGRLGRTIQPVMQPLGYDWQLTVGVLTSFAAREVFASTMGVVVAGTEDVQDAGVRNTIAHALRDDGTTLVFSPATSWSVLVFFVLAMQCLPTLVVTARESGHFKWALLQLSWMSGLAYVTAMIVYQVLS